MIRTKGEAGTGNVVEAVRHVRTVMGEIRKLQTMDEDELFVFAKEVGTPHPRKYAPRTPHAAYFCGVLLSNCLQKAAHAPFLLQRAHAASSALPHTHLPHFF